MKSFVVIFCLCCGGISFCFHGTPGEAEVIDKIVAILDEELILLSEVREYTEKPIARVIANLDASSDVDRDILRYMIERQLLLRSIQYLAFPKEKELVQTLATQYIINTYHNKNAQAFAEKVQTQGITEIEIEQELTLYMKGVDYIRRKHRFTEDIDDPDVVLELFREWVGELQAQVKVQTLF
jgi:hypothetical protein